MEYEWSKLREQQLEREMDAIASSTTQKIAERKADEQLAAKCRKETELYKNRKTKAIAVRTIIYATGNNQ